MRISVLLPCYDAAPYLAEALRSAVTQGVALHEVIVVDDGSVDDSAAVAERFGAGVRCVREEHRGIGAARNRALELATGDVIAFLDADDLWTPESLASRLALLEGDSSLEVVSGLVEQFISPELSPEVRAELLCPPGAQRGGTLGAMLVRRRAFERVGGFDSSLRVGETIDWIARARAAGIAMGELERVVLRRRIHATNTGRRQRQARSDYLRVLKASLDRQRTPSARQPDP